jgi:putative nucleotidyltransferase with HDIG domain
MLLAIVNEKIADQQDIIYFRFPIDIMNQYPWVLTDASANTIIAPNFYDNASDLEQLNWACIDSLDWRMPSERAKRARQAELLIHRRVDIKSSTRIIVWNKWTKKNVLSAYAEAQISPPPIGYDEIHFYTDFYNSGENSIVTGPRLRKKAYQETIDDLLQEINKAASPKFDKLSSMIENGLKKDFGCLPETEELIDLKTNNWIHKHDVATHTLKVVEELHKLREFGALNKADQLLVEVSAYLHDIGKGPKSRWADKGGRQDVDLDHPVKALPMLHRIFTEELKMITERSARVICKLVCYHDLIGDVTGKSRRVEELIDVVENERELNMLIALGKADIQAIHPDWVNDTRIEEVREQVLEALQSEASDE